MPQIGQLTEDSWYLISQLFWLAVVFGAIFFVIGRGMLPKVEATIDARDRKIADDIAAAQAARDDADRIEADWRNRTNASRADAQGVVAAAKARAQHASESRLAKADAKIGSQLAAAEVAITSARTAAMVEVEGVASSAAQDLVLRLTGAQTSPADATQAVKAHLHV